MKSSSSIMMFGVAIIIIATMTTIHAAYTADEVITKFAEWRNKYNKVYASADEYSVRLANFAATLERVDSMNAKNTTAHFGTTKFADMSREEFKQKMLTLQPSSLSSLNGVAAAPSSHARLHDPTPTSWDWKDQKGTMTYVKDQGQCGSCWAFSVVENIESAWKLAGHDLVELSPQQVVSCDTVDQGCDGGDPQTAYQYIMGAGGLQTDKDYPYYSGDSGWSEKCEVKPDKFVAHVSNFSYGVPPCNDTCKNQTQYEQTVRDALYTIGPLSICVDASDWQDYEWGIFMGFCGTRADDLDHAVLLTGFDEKYGYYNVRNSWASDWGEDGYIRLALGRNECGMLDLVTYATVPHA